MRTSQEITGRWIQVAILGITALAAAIRFYHLDYQSLWRDETDAVRFALRDIPTLVGNFTAVGENGALFFLMLHGWLRLAGTSEFALRFPSLFFGTLAVPTTYALGRRIAGPRVALGGAFLLALSPYAVWYSQEGKMYGLVTFLAPFSLLLVGHAVERQAWRLALAWACILVAFLYVHFYAPLMVVVGLVWFLILGWRRLRFTPVIGAALTALVLGMAPVLRWLIPAALQPGETGYGRYTLGEMVSILLRAFTMGLRPTDGWIPVALFALLLLAAGLVFFPGPWKDLRRGAILLLLWLAVAVGGTWGVCQIRPLFTDRYLILALPAFCLLLALGADAVDRLIPRAFPSLLLVCLLAFIPFLWIQSHTPIKANFRAATAYIRQQMQPGDAVMYLMPYIQHSFAYYGLQPERLIDPPYTAGMDTARAAVELSRRIGDTRRVILVLSEAGFWDPPGFIEPWFRSHGRLECAATFTYVEVRCFALR